MRWTINLDITRKQAVDLLGLIPSFLDENDPGTAREQLDANYQHGGGWHPMQGFTINNRHQLEYLGDPPYDWVAFTMLRGELVRVFRYAWVAIGQPDGSTEVARMD